MPEDKTNKPSDNHEILKNEILRPNVPVFMLNQWQALIRVAEVEMHSTELTQEQEDWAQAILDSSVNDQGALFKGYNLEGHDIRQMDDSARTIHMEQNTTVLTGEDLTKLYKKGLVSIYNKSVAPSQDEIKGFSSLKPEVRLRYLATLYRRDQFAQFLIRAVDYASYAEYGIEITQEAHPEGHLGYGFRSPQTATEFFHAFTNFRNSDIFKDYLLGDYKDEVVATDKRIEELVLEVKPVDRGQYMRMKGLSKYAPDISIKDLVRSLLDENQTLKDDAYLSQLLETNRDEDVHKLVELIEAEGARLDLEKGFLSTAREFDTENYLDFTVGEVISRIRSNYRIAEIEEQLSLMEKRAQLAGSDAESISALMAMCYINTVFPPMDLNPEDPEKPNHSPYALKRLIAFKRLGLPYDLPTFRDSQGNFTLEGLYANIKVCKDLEKNLSTMPNSTPNMLSVNF